MGARGKREKGKGQQSMARIKGGLHSNDPVPAVAAMRKAVAVSVHKHRSTRKVSEVEYEEKQGLNAHRTVKRSAWESGKAREES